MSLVRTIAPVVEPVSVQEVQRQARAGDSPEERSSLLGYIASARSYAENYTGRSLITQTWQMTADSAFPEVIYLRRPPVQSIASIVYVDGAGVEQTLAASAYQADFSIEPAVVQSSHGQSWPATRMQLCAVKVTYAAGYGDTALSVPPDIRQAISLLVTSFFDERGATSADWDGFHRLLEPYRVLEVV